MERTSLTYEEWLKEPGLFSLKETTEGEHSSLLICESLQ